MYDRKFLKNAKSIVDSEEFSSGGILDRAKEAAIPQHKESINDIMIANRSKRRSSGTRREK
jgi:hypothetical protein